MKNISLDLLEIETKAKIVEIKSKGSIKRRLLDMGLIEDATIQCVFVSPFGDPHAYEIKGATIAIRNDDAKNILVRCI